MLFILNALFASNGFWRLFTQEFCTHRGEWLRVNYRYTAYGRDILLRFTEHQELVKTLAVVIDGEIVVDYLYFLTLEELTLFLHRVSGIRAAFPSGTDSESIIALSCASKTAR